MTGPVVELPGDPVPEAERRPGRVPLTASLWARLWEIARFSAVGGVAYIVDVGLYNLLRSGIEVFADSPIKAKIVSVAVATLVSWIGNRYFTFRSRRTDSKVRELVLFTGINLAGIAIQLICLWVSHYLLGFTSLLADNISGNVIGVALAMVFRYLAYRHLVFTAPTQASATTTTSGVTAASARDTDGDDPAGR